jgi:hypothetical protein
MVMLRREMARVAWWRDSCVWEEKTAMVMIVARDVRIRLP